MSKIDELIAQYCPDGVEYKELGDVCNFRNGFAFKSSKFKVKGQPILRIGNIQNRKVDISNLIYFDIDDYSENLKPFEVLNGDVLVAMSGATTGKIGRLNSKEVFYLNQRVGKFEPNIELLQNNFLYHYLLTKSEELYVLAGGGAQPNLSSTTLMRRITIPVPPLLVQEAIVEILDKFTALEAELEAELEARTRQYEYYRNELLAFDGKDVEWKTLGDIGEFTRGKRFVRTDMVKSGFPCIHYGEMYTHYNIYATESKSFIKEELAVKLRKAKKGDVVIVAAGETIEDIGKATAWLGDSDVVTHDACFTFSSPLNPKFVAYFSRTKLFHNQIKRHISSGKISAINSKGLAQAKIPVPSIEEQNRIVTILDKFDALVNDISSGLPAEIKARREQYEYYRGKLLSFEPKST